MTIPDTG